MARALGQDGFEETPHALVAAGSLVVGVGGIPEAPVELELRHRVDQRAERFPELLK